MEVVEQNRVILTETNNILSKLRPTVLTPVSPQEGFEPFKNYINPCLSSLISLIHHEFASILPSQPARLSSLLSSCPKLATFRGHHQKSKVFQTGYLSTSTYHGKINR